MQGLKKEYIYIKILKDLKKEFCCNDIVVQDPKLGQAPELHAEIHRHGLGHQMMGADDGPSTSSGTETAKKKKSNDLKYDIFGWIILAVGIYAWLESAKSNVPPPPPQQ